MRPGSPSDFVPLESLQKAPEAPRHWRSLEEYHNGGPATSEEPDVDPYGPDGTSRRHFVSLLGASLGLAGLTGCTRQPTEFIVPYVNPPAEATPGKPQFFATAIHANGIAEGVLVECHLGRPTKVEGNPDHPASLGATSVTTQASVLDLYNPDRARQITYRGEPKSWEQFLIALREMLTDSTGAGVHILTETVTSPSLAGQIDAVLTRFPQTQWHQWEPAGRHTAREGARLSFGRDISTHYRLDQADVVVTLDSDFLSNSPGSTRYARDFIARRRRGDRTDMNRLYAVESCMTPTGGKADHRLALRYSDIELFARELSGVLAGNPPTAGYPHARFVAALAQDLNAHRGASAILVGEHQSPAVHSLAHRMNASLDNIGRTVVHTESIEHRPMDQIQSIRDLAAALDAGSVKTLFILGGNPVYNAPADLQFVDKLQRAGTIICLSPMLDETASYSHWHLPESHFFEEWGDARTFDGMVTILQPLIYPLYESHSSLQVLDAMLAAPGRSSYEIVRDYWSRHAPSRDFEGWWRKSVHDGVIEGSALPAITPVVNSTALPGPAAPPNGLEIVFRTDPYLHDGRYTGNSWLMELPRPMTKLTWDNAVHLSPATAKRLEFESQQVVTIELRGRKVDAAVWIQAGHPDESATVELGFGRTRAGRAGNGAGFNAYALRPSDALWLGAGATMQKTGRSFPLASTQVHQTMEGRDLIISAAVDRYRNDPDTIASNSQEPTESLYPQWSYTGAAWGMSIDLTACVNCNACVVACQAENNIPVVGKGEVENSREMHWLRVDTYYEGDPANPTAHYQPVPCMQCENAPCELVCPVHATVHSADGLNDMTYNRCVGTRYCSNNCPYKVRRFNFFLFQDWVTESLKLQRNPDVTVRSRGVMEKCTYCVQRIRRADIDARIEDRPIRDGGIQTACQQACPTQAIVFGDINNRDSRVAQLKAHKLNYPLLPELNTRPRTTYMAELRNPNPALNGGAA